MKTDPLGGPIDLKALHTDAVAKARTEMRTAAAALIDLALESVRYRDRRIGPTLDSPA